MSERTETKHVHRNSLHLNPHVDNKNSHIPFQILEGPYHTLSKCSGYTTETNLCVRSLFILIYILANHCRV